NTMTAAEKAINGAFEASELGLTTSETLRDVVILGRSFARTERNRTALTRRERSATTSRRGPVVHTCSTRLKVHQVQHRAWVAHNALRKRLLPPLGQTEGGDMQSVFICGLA
ncbi:hypothetical protein LTR53_016832, partial [Teratosphaeriaceae sp. CCFEE 6253]